MMFLIETIHKKMICFYLFIFIFTFLRLLHPKSRLKYKKVDEMVISQFFQNDLLVYDLKIDSYDSNYFTIGSKEEGDILNVDLR